MKGLRTFQKGIGSMKEIDRGSLQVHQLIYLIWTAIVKVINFYSINFVTKQKFTHNYCKLQTDVNIYWRRLKPSEYGWPMSTKITLNLRNLVEYHRRANLTICHNRTSRIWLFCHFQDKIMMSNSYPTALQFDPLQMFRWRTKTVAKFRNKTWQTLHEEEIR